MNSIICSIIVLGAIGILAALLLSWVSRRFAVKEDSRIDEVEALLPGANCGGCGMSGCRAFAVACCSADTLDGLECPGGGKETMKKIAAVVGLEPVASLPKVAVIKCAGDCASRTRIAVYDGAPSCAVMSACGSGESLCGNSCLGCGDCVRACGFGALSVDKDSRLAVVDDKKCTGCGACVAACPRSIIELRPYGPRGMRIWVACSNRQRGAQAMKVCANACLGCGKCTKVCSHEAITVTDNLAYIDPAKCKLCRKCVDTCPTDAIHKANFPESNIYRKQPAANEKA
ncbi:MAG: RnfABCDGE type electron transport complex subunit B [Muribaculaceae bacterium]|nr:RnfABCDGE type electron transport complex subunit B [Muribaculaceae bacterium]